MKNKQVFLCAIQMAAVFAIVAFATITPIAPLFEATTSMVI